ncbi:putative nucleoporin NUP88/NUP82 [Helianthus annuus]|uniref:Nucleoporin NUP88/NUP82 n=2 Tax=Helianthus annuus TaxID=4232 RepID=A0A9K3EFZ9_HELAN|nr:putative nucleoporin NUP88/NUP82 [Helianthus annuus]KAJ0496646.1 putative nucleoporin NUP88/NUP82 [Helianthus annuus]KAJ0670200.1 putative nucleoporin NUP88/NUP82 [Helianthus annuus]
MRLSTVQSVLNTCQVESSVSSLYGFVALADSFGSCWIVGLTSGFECIVLGMESWNLLLPAHVDKEKKFESLEENTVPGDATIISKELLAGPKVVIVPPTSPNPVAADSIEGRSTLHQYFKLFHENYVEYAHKVYFELKHHGPQLKKIIDEQHARLREAQQKLAKVEEKQENLENRIDRVIQTHGLLEERLLNLRNLLGIHKKPLSKAEREFKMELDKFRGVEIDALHTTIETINGRIKRYSSSPQSKRPNQRRLIAGRRMSNAEDDEMAHLKSSIAKLSLVNSENTKKVKLVDSALRNHESSS